ncbi:tyrosine-type recombinase/integrase [Paraburkholderia sp. IW21]|uniref:tyrosine-type recombinase/integrase n=1 Tax=Paraburkholderia sp. IW21 TaxID=3242488 RepID=UPI0035201D66
MNPEFKGAHLLRYSLATELLRRGASLDDWSIAPASATDDDADLRQGGYRCATAHRPAAAGECIMRKSPVTPSSQISLDQYLALRRALGVKLRLPGRLLQSFVDFVDAAGATYIPTDLALAWATQPANVQPAQWANRLGMARRLAQYCSASDPRTLIPSPDLLPYLQRPEPYIYRDEDIDHLLELARQLPSATGLRPHTYATLFGLYVATGLRINEALHLDCDDVDLVNGVLTIRESKFGKSE